MRAPLSPSSTPGRGAPPVGLTRAARRGRPAQAARKQPAAAVHAGLLADGCALRAGPVCRGRRRYARTVWSPNASVRVATRRACRVPFACSRWRSRSASCSCAASAAYFVGFALCAPLSCSEHCVHPCAVACRNMAPPKSRGARLQADGRRRRRPCGRGGASGSRCATRPAPATPGASRRRSCATTTPRTAPRSRPRWPRRRCAERPARARASRPSSARLPSPRPCRPPRRNNAGAPAPCGSSVAQRQRGAGRSALRATLRGALSACCPRFQVS